MTIGTADNVACFLFGQQPGSIGAVFRFCEVMSLPFGDWLCTVCPKTGKTNKQETTGGKTALQNRTKNLHFSSPLLLWRLFLRVLPRSKSCAAGLESVLSGLPTNRQLYCYNDNCELTTEAD